MRTIMVMLFICGLLGCSSRKVTVNELAVENFDIQRYMGRWYEIARFDNRFERGLSHVTADYSMRSDGKVRVVNSGQKSNGRVNTSTGKAQFRNAKQQPPKGELEVAFFLNFFAPYNILVLDKDYNYALISSGDDFLWILSREPELQQSTVDTLLSVAEQRGFDTSKLLFIEQ